jgi:hypothetical protein
VSAITEPLAVHLLLTSADIDEIDEAVADAGPSRTRKSSEVDRLMSLLDEIGEDGEG